MVNRSRRTKSLSDQEKERIARDMIDGYKKMADLNRELAEEGLRNNDDDETK